MSLTFDSTGLTIQTYQEIVDELVAAYQSLYGADIDVAADTPDGQRIGIEAKARLDIQTFALDLYNALDPDFATGEALNRILKLAGLSRGTPTRSQVDVNITTDRTVELPIGYTVQDDLGQNWVADSPATLLAGVTATTLFAENFGAVAAAADTVTTPATVVLGVTAVTNPLLASPGRDEETDVAARVRRNGSLVVPATSSRAGLFTALGDLEGVTDLAVYENQTDITDVALALAAHSIWAVVEGGDIPDIVERIVKTKTGGTGLKGSVSGTFIETLTRPDGTPYVITHTAVFDRPTPVDLHVELTVEGVDSEVVDTVAIKAALAALDSHIGELQSASDLYATVRSVPGNFTTTLLEISDDGISFTDGVLTPAADEVYRIQTANITITDIT